MKSLIVKDLMAKNPAMIGAEKTLQDAAAKMKELNCGVLPVGSKNNILGVITDRDIVIRAIAEGKNPAQEKVSNHMTDKAIFCNDTDTIRHASSIMKKNKVGRLLVKGEKGEISGILTFGCILRKHSNVEEIADIIVGVKKRDAA